MWSASLPERAAHQLREIAQYVSHDLPGRISGFALEKVDVRLDRALLARKLRQLTLDLGVTATPTGFPPVAFDRVSID